MKDIHAGNRLLIGAALLLVMPAAGYTATPLFGPAEPVISGGSPVEVPGYSVPSFVDWDEDGLADLIVGEGGGGVVDGKVRIYINTGSEASPVFSGYFYVQSLGADLVRTGGG